MEGTPSKPATPSTPNQFNIAKLLRNGKYLGLALLAAYSNLLWLTEGTFYYRSITNWDVTIAWIINLVTLAATLPAVLFFLGRNKHLFEHRSASIVVPLATTIISLALCFYPPEPVTTLGFYILSFLLGVAESLFWILWAECHTCGRSRYSFGHIGITFGVTYIVSIAVVLLLPPIMLPVFVSILPAISGVLLVLSRKEVGTTFPVLLPKKAAAIAYPNVRVICIVCFSACGICSFLGGIIPQGQLPISQGLALGMSFCGAILLILVGIYFATGKRQGIFQLCPWVVVLCIVSFALYLNGAATLFPAFGIALGCALIFQILLLIYFGKLATKGYVAATLTFGMSVVCTYSGFAIGDTISLIVEAFNAPLYLATTNSICLLCMCLLALLLIPLTRQEFALTKLMSDPVSPSRSEQIQEEMSKEFNLSPRETEILRMLAKGASTNKIAQTFVISPNTVNTHIRHIYEKTSIHTREELIDYVNMRSTEEQEVAQHLN